MITTAQSRAPKPNPDFYEVKRRRGEDNARWLRRLLSDYKPQGVVMLLFAGTDALSFRLRVAQAHVRHDMTPSWWSHVALVTSADTRDISRSRLIEISLDPARSFGWPPTDNAVQSDVPVARYFDARRFPNIAVVDLPPAPTTATAGQPPTTRARGATTPAAQQQADLSEALGRFKKMRGTLDCCELVLQWLGYAWGAGQLPNPLVAGRGIPSAVLVESLTATLGFELTPGIDSRAACPEAVWQGARWWYPLHEKVAARRLAGAYCTEHELVPSPT